MKFALALFAALLLGACASTQPTDEPRPNGGSGAFSGGTDEDPFVSGPGKPVITSLNETEADRARWDWYTDVLNFRGVKMPRLLRELESKDPANWGVARERVVPPVKRPAKWPPQLVDSRTETQKDGTVKLIEKRIALTREQEAYRQYLMWPKEIRTRLQAADWNTAPNREWLALQGRLYALVYEFDTATPLGRADRETDRWLDFADAMTAQGPDGEQMLISNMIVRLGHDQQDYTQNAHIVLVRVGPNAIQPLLDALWVALAGNPNFNKNVVVVLADFRDRAVGPAITELMEGQRGGVTWRARRHLVDLLGRLRDARGIRAITEEIEKTDIQEFKRDENDQVIFEDGKAVVDPRRTENAVFLFHECCIAALGSIGRKEGLKPILDLWEKEPDHIDGAQAAIYEITGKRVETLQEARALAAKLK